MGTVHVADEVTCGPIGEASQRLHRHRRPQIRPANSNVDDVGDVARLVQVVHSVHEIQHALANGQHALHDILSIHLKVVAAIGPKGHVQHCAVFCGVELDA